MEDIEKNTEIVEDSILQKPKKPRSEKQIAAFEKARAARVEKCRIKNQKVEELKEEIKATSLPELKEQEEKEKDDENVETIVIKKQKPKPRKKQIVIVEESDEEEEPETEVVYKRPQTRAIKRQSMVNFANEPERPKICFF